MHVASAYPLPVPDALYNTSERHVPKHLSSTIPALESVGVPYGGTLLTPSS